MSNNLYPKIRFDGLYQANEHASSEPYKDDAIFSITKRYLRFFPDGQVLDMSAIGTLDSIKDWFNKNCKHCSIGQFQITGQRIQFTTANEIGKIVYEGIIYDNNELDLIVTSMINNYKSNYKYQFIKIDWIE